MNLQSDDNCQSVIRQFANERKYCGIEYRPAVQGERI